MSYRELCGLMFLFLSVDNDKTALYSAAPRDVALPCPGPRFRQSKLLDGASAEQPEVRSSARCTKQYLPAVPFFCPWERTERESQPIARITYVRMCCVVYVLRQQILFLPVDKPIMSLYSAIQGRFV